jgi:hypothetical protein
MAFHRRQGPQDQEGHLDCLGRPIRPGGCRGGTGCHLVAAKRRVSGCHKGTPATDKGDWFMFDAGIAMKHIVLAAWNFGLGTVHVELRRKKAEAGLKNRGIFYNRDGPARYFEETPRETPRKPSPNSSSSTPSANPMKTVKTA